MIGTILGTRYELIEKIGEGGMAEVYKSKDLLLNRFVAVKILKKQYLSDKEFVEKFKNEASSAAGLSAINIVNIYDVGTENNINYIVMELINGKTLKQLINGKGYIDIENAIDISIQIGKALVCAHKNNIIHRDIKPHNILVTEDGIVKVTDFGIAKATDSSTITNTSKVMGSAHYFSPEQAKGSYIDARTDIYSLGILIYEMLTGKVPFDAESPVSVALKHIQEPVIPPKVINNKIPSGLNNLIMKCIEKEAIKRYQTSQELLNDLYRIKDNSEYSIVTNTLDDDNTKIMDPIVIDNNDMKDIKEKEKNKSNNKKRKSISKIVVPISIIACILVVSFLIFNRFINNPNRIAEVVIPKVVGFTKEKAMQEIEKTNLNFVLGESENSEEQKGIVLRTIPKDGENVKVNTDVIVIVSDGPQKIIVNDFRGIDYITAKNLIRNESLTVGSIDFENSDAVPKGSVISQIPNPGSEIEKNSKIDLLVSEGPKIKLVEVPDLTDLTLNQAKTILKLYKLELGEIIESPIDSEDLDGKIFSQGTDAGNELKEGSKINVSYYVYDAKEVQRIEVPKFVGKTVKEARIISDEIGVKINVFGQEEDIVKSQDKDSGTKIYIGDIVNLSVE